jgi:hypothetical protein
VSGRYLGDEKSRGVVRVRGRKIDVEMVMVVVVEAAVGVTDAVDGGRVSSSSQAAANCPASQGKTRHQVPDKTEPI